MAVRKEREETARRAPHYATATVMHRVLTLAMKASSRHSEKAASRTYLWKERRDHGPCHFLLSFQLHQNHDRPATGGQNQEHLSTMAAGTRDKEPSSPLAHLRMASLSTTS